MVSEKEVGEIERIKGETRQNNNHFTPDTNHAQVAELSNFASPYLAAKPIKGEPIMLPKQTTGSEILNKEEGEISDHETRPKAIKAHLIVSFNQNLGLQSILF